MSAGWPKEAPKAPVDRAERSAINGADAIQRAFLGDVANVRRARRHIGVVLSEVDAANKRAKREGDGS
jgi:hypothetical protein